MRNRLTAIQIKKAGPGKLEDGAGLRLIKTATSAKWVYRFSHLGKRREMGIGTLDSVSLSQARQIRDQWAAELAAGRDPIEVRNAQKRDTIAQRDREDPTFAAFTDRVFEGRKAQLRGDGSRGRWMSQLTLHVIPHIGHKRISEIHQSDIHDAMKPIWKDMHPTAIKAMRRMRIIFEQAKLAGYEADPFTVDAAKHMLGAVDHQTKHLSATPWQDIPDLYERLSAHGGVGQCIQWHILTLVRSNAGRGARLEEIDGDIWTVPAERIKGRRGHVKEFRVPLPPEAIELIELARPFATEYLWPGQRVGHLSDQALTKLLRRMGETGTVHGLRTSFRTWVQDTDAAGFEVAETMLGHSIGSSVERAYARSDLLERRRQVANAWAKFVTGQNAAGVLQFPALNDGSKM